MLIVPVMAAPVGALSRGPATSTQGAPATGDGGEDRRNPPSPEDLDGPGAHLFDDLVRRAAVAPNEDGSPRAPGVPSGESMEDLIDADGLTSTRLLAERARSMIAHRFDAEPAPLPPLEDAGEDADGSDSTSDVVTVQHHFSGTVRFGLPGGDMTGDGLADVLVESFDLSNGSIGVTALDQDGAVLWNRDFLAEDDIYDAFPVPAGDLDGDGADDVLLVSLRLPGSDVTGDCIVAACALSGELDLEWGLEVVSGPDGETLWKEDSPGYVRQTLVYASEIAIFAYADVVEAENLFVLPSRAISDALQDDAGVGAAVLIDSIDLDGVFGLARAGFLAYVLASDAIYQYTTDYALRDGATGDIMIEGTLGPNLDVPLALSAGDLNADGTADLFLFEPENRFGPLVCAIPAITSVCASGRRNVAFTISAQDGATGDILWEADHGDPTAGYSFPMVHGDHSGDGASDVLVLRIADDSSRSTLALIAVDGATGEALWDGEVGTDGFVPVSLGDADGDGRDDVLVFGFSSGGAAQLAARSGTDGAVLWEVEVDGGGGLLFFTVLLEGGDLDADGVQDHLVVVVSIVCNSHCDFVYETTAVSGADGQVLWNLDDVAFGAGPLDGAAGDDVARVVFEGECATTWTLSALRGHDLAEIWSRSDTVALGSGLALAEAGGTMDADPSHEVIYSLFAVLSDGTVESNVRPLAGHSGDALWTFGDILDAPTDCPGEEPVGTVNFYAAQEIAAKTVNTSGWTSLSIGDEQLSEAITIPTTPFFDDNVTEMTVSSNGFVYLGPPDGFSGCCGGEPIPQDDRVNGMVAGVWTDLDSRECGEVSYNVSDDRVRVAFEDVPYYNEVCDPFLPEVTGETSRRVSFWIEVVPDNGTVEVHLLRVDGKYTATTGIESSLGDVGNETRRTPEELSDPVAWRFALREGEAVPPPTIDQDDAGSGGDAGDERSDALQIAPGDYTGTLDPGAGDSEDWYAVEASAGDTVGASVDPLSANFDLQLVGPGGEVLDGSFTVGDAVENVEAVAEEDGLHYLRVLSSHDAGDYGLSVAVEAPPSFDPRVETLSFTGDIDCAVALSGVLVTNDLCGGLPVVGGAGAHSFPVGFDPGATSVHVEVHWDDDAATLGADRLLYFWSGYTGELEDAEGTSPIVHDQALGPGTSWYLTGRNGTLGVQVSRDATGPLVVDQPFTVCVAIMYGGADLPADFACEA